MGFKINRKSISDQLVEHFSKEIRSGKYRPGDEFPSERTLEQQFGVSRKTIGKVVSILAAQGYLFKEQGCTTYVADYKKQYAAPSGERCFGVLFNSPVDVCHPASAPIFQELCNVLRDAGYGIRLIFLQRLTPDDFQEQLRISPVAGLFFFMGANPELLPLCEVAGSPVVILCGSSSGRSAASVACDVVAALQEAVQLMLDNGRRHIAFFYGNKQWETDLDRIAAFQQMLRENIGSCHEEMLAQTNYERGKTLENLKRILPKHPDGIIAADDMVASWIVEELTAQKVRIPEDIAVIGFNDMTMYSLRTVPELTTFSIPAEQIARQALQEMQRLLAGGETEPACILVHMPLLRRGTL